MQKIIILDFGSQTTQLIARRLRELHQYCEIVPYNKFPTDDKDVIGVILSGSPFCVGDEKAFKPDLSKIRGRVPILGICYGAQLLVDQSGGSVEKSDTREYGRAQLNPAKTDDSLMKSIAANSQVWMSHGDTITKMPANFRTIASTTDVENAAFKIDDEETYGVQFHPEVAHTEIGNELLQNFLTICGAEQDWTTTNFIETTVAELKQKIGNDKVILALSGGVDSTVTAQLLNRAIGQNLICIFVNHGLLRKNEFHDVLEMYKQLNLNVTGVDASDYFYEKLAGVTDPETKRKIIGAGFIDVFQREAAKIPDAKWLAQGTIYPDVIESLSISGHTIKSHHNVGGLPEKMRLKLVEPLRLLFKDEVREIGRDLGLSKQFIGRHAFPGPGLGIRIIGDITRERVELLQDADDIFIRELRSANLYDGLWQAHAILLPIKSVGVMGDERTYESVVALGAIDSRDGMTADFARLPHEFLAKVSNEIIRKVRGVNRVVYDISSKPPATIEWE